MYTISSMSFLPLRKKTNKRNVRSTQVSTIVLSDDTIRQHLTAVQYPTVAPRPTATASTSELLLLKPCSKGQKIYTIRRFVLFISIESIFCRTHTHCCRSFSLLRKNRFFATFYQFFFYILSTQRPILTLFTSFEL